MNDNIKTIGFVSAGIVAVIIAIVTFPRAEELSDRAEVGKLLFPDNEKTKAESIASISILKQAPDTGRLEAISVKQQNGRWVLSEHGNYPADNKDYSNSAVKAAFEAMTQVKIYDFVTKNINDHEKYGVVAPDKKKPNQAGVGLLVSVKDPKDEVLAEFVVGEPFRPKDSKAADDLRAPPAKDEFRYVRLLNSNYVYVAKLDTQNWSTAVKDWIKSKVLDIDPFEVKQVALSKYSINATAPAQNGLIAAVDVSRQSVATLDAEESKLKLAAYATYDANDNATKLPVTDAEEVDTAKLDTLKTALESLPIVDVKKLREAMRNNDDIGIFPAPTENGSSRIFTSGGEVVVRMKNGVEYVLLFGERTVAAKEKKAADKNSTEGPADKDKSGKDATEKKPDSAKPADPADAKKPDGAPADPAEIADKTVRNRYVMVRAQLNPNLVAKPERPESPPDPPSDLPGKDEPKKEPKADAGKNGAGDNLNPKANSDAGSPADNKAKPKKPVGMEDVLADGEDNPLPPKAKNKAAPLDQVGDDPDAKPEDPKATRARLEAEYEKKVKDYQDKLRKAQVKVQEQNERFREWIYIVPDAEYNKIFLSRDAMVHKKEKPKGQGDSPEDFDELKKGLNSKPKNPFPTTPGGIPQNP